MSDESICLNLIDDELLKIIALNLDVVFVVNVLSTLNKKFRNLFYDKNFLSVLDPDWSYKLANHTLEISKRKAYEAYRKLMFAKSVKSNLQFYIDPRNLEEYPYLVPKDSHAHKALERTGYQFSEPEVKNVFFETNVSRRELNDRGVVSVLSGMEANFGDRLVRNPGGMFFMNRNNIEQTDGCLIGHQELASQIKYEEAELLVNEKMPLCFTSYGLYQKSKHAFCFIKQMELVRVLPGTQ